MLAVSIFGSVSLETLPDFLDGCRLFDGRPICTAPSPRGGEQRWISIGELDGEMIAIVWTWRGAAIRIITMRKTRDEEKRRYGALYGLGN